MLTIPVYKGKDEFTKLIVYFGCLYFCVYYLHDLFAKRYRTYFELTDSQAATWPFLSICVSLRTNPKWSTILREKVEFGEKDNLTSDEPYEDELNYGAFGELSNRTLNRVQNYLKLVHYYDIQSVSKTPKQILDRARELKIHDSFRMDPSTEEIPSYYLNANRLCLKYNLENISRFDMHNNHKLTNRMFFHRERYAYDFHNYFHIQMCRDFIDCEEYEFKFMQFLSSFSRPPFGTQCIEHEKAEFEFGGVERIDHEELCRQECIKATNHIAGYFFSDRDSQPLNFTDVNFKEENNENQCNERCSRKECRQAVYLSMMKNMFTGNHTSYEYNFYYSKGILATETAYISEFDFYLNLIGFVSLLFSISLSLAISNIGLLINFQCNFRLTKVCFCVGHFVLLSLNAYAILKTYDLIGYYLNQPTDPQNSRGLFEYHEFNLHVCFPLAVVVNDTSAHSGDFQEIRQGTKAILQRNNLEQMETRSLPPEELINRIYYNYRKAQNQLDVSRPSDFAFLNSEYPWTTPDEKSMPLSIYSKWVPKLQEPNYRALMRASSLVIQSKGAEFNIFFTEKSKRLTSNDRQLSRDQTVELHIKEWSEEMAGCQNYAKSHLQCDSHQSCITNCILKRFTSEHDQLPPVVVDKENFLVKYKRYSYNLSKANELQVIKEQCEREYPLDDCYSARYLSVAGERRMPFRKNKAKFSPYFLIRHQQAGIKKNLLSVLVDITTMYCILVGLSYPQMVGLVYKLALSKSQIFYRLNKQNGFRFYMRTLRRLVTLAFFLYYFRIVLCDSINGMVQSTYVNANLPKLMFPTFGLCFKINNKRSLNNLTGHELKALANNISVESVLSNIKYINTENEKVNWKPNDQFDSIFKINPMFYLGRKCFEFNYTLNVREHRLNRHNFGLQIKLNDNGLKDKFYYYYTRSREGSSFSRFHLLKPSHHYGIHFAIEKIRYHDSFQTIKNPLRLFLAAPEIRSLTYLQHLKRDFERRCKASTLLLPLYQDSFGLKIRDDLFERFVDTAVAQRERFAVDYNFDIEYPVEFISSTFNKTYELNFSKRIDVVIQSTESSCTFVTFFTNLLNLFTFWFDLSVTQCLHSGIQCLTSQLLRIYRWTVRQIVLLVERRKRNRLD